MKSAGGVVVGGGIAAAKIGGLGKFFLWLFAWHGVNSAWRFGGWIALALIAAAVTLYFVIRSRRQNA